MQVIHRCGIARKWKCGRVAWLIAIIPFLYAGCGQSNRVTGTVTFDGKPLPAGQVTFLCDGKGRPAIAATISAAGAYEIVNPPTGRAHVFVRTFKPQPKPPPGVDPETGRDYSADWVDTGPFVPIPKKYASPETSGLEYRIIPGDQTFDIVLTK